MMSEITRKCLPFDVIEQVIDASFAQGTVGVLVLIFVIGILHRSRLLMDCFSVVIRDMRHEHMLWKKSWRRLKREIAAWHRGN
jgi:hypothetical protein